MPGRLAFDLDFGRPGGKPLDDDDPLRILVLGDFSGTPTADRPPLASRRPTRVDIDTLDDVMLRVGPKLQTPAGEISFRRVADFHPDHLFGTDLFQRLRHSRANPPAGSDDIGRLLGKPAIASGGPAATPASGIDALIHNIVAPHVVKDVPVETRGHLAAVDAAMAEQMRTLLHAPEFQSRESAWRGAHWLISNVELDGPLSLHLFDVTREELLADLVAAEGKVARSGLHQALVDRWRSESEGRGRSLLVGLFDFGASDTDIGLLAAAGLIASRAGGPFLAGADVALASGEEEALSSWRALRRSEAAPWIGSGRSARAAADALRRADRSDRIVLVRGVHGKPCARRVPLGPRFARHCAADRAGVQCSRLGDGAGRRARDRGPACVTPSFEMVRG